MTGPEPDEVPTAVIVRFDTEADDAETIGDLAARCWLLGCVGIEEGPTALRVTFPDRTVARSAAARIGRPVTEPVPVTDPLLGWVAPMEAVVFRTGRPPADTDPVIITIDPGRAFGSGSHPSTRGALDLLGRGHPPRHVLDAGTGTGVLAIAAAAMGAQTVMAVDVEPDAIEIARANVNRNEAASVVEVEQLSIEDVDGRYDLALVNLTIDHHEAVATVVAGRLAVGGAVIGSGVLAGDQEARLQAAYPALVLSDRCEIDGWVAVRLISTHR